MNIWDILGIEQTSDVSTIRKAYAKKVKSTHPEDDPEGYQRLREAYQWAVNHAKSLSREKEDIRLDKENVASFFEYNTKDETKQPENENYKTKQPENENYKTKQPENENYKTKQQENENSKVNQQEESETFKIIFEYEDKILQEEFDFDEVFRYKEKEEIDQKQLKKDEESIFKEEQKKEKEKLRLEEERKRNLQQLYEKENKEKEDVIQNLKSHRSTSSYGNNGSFFSGRISYGSFFVFIILLCRVMLSGGCGQSQHNQEVNYDPSLYLQQKLFEQQLESHENTQKNDQKNDQKSTQESVMPLEEYLNRKNGY